MRLTRRRLFGQVARVTALGSITGLAVCSGRCAVAQTATGHAITVPLRCSDFAKSGTFSVRHDYANLDLAGGLVWELLNANGAVVYQYVLSSPYPGRTRLTARDGQGRTATMDIEIVPEEFFLFGLFGFRQTLIPEYLNLAACYQSGNQSESVALTHVFADSQIRSFLAHPDVFAGIMNRFLLREMLQPALGMDNPSGLPAALAGTGGVPGSQTDCPTLLLELAIKSILAEMAFEDWMTAVGSLDFVGQLISLRDLFSLKREIKREEEQYQEECL